MIVWKWVGVGVIFSSWFMWLYACNWFWLSQLYTFMLDLILSYLCVLFVLSLYIVHGVNHVHMPCYLHIPLLLRTIVISHSLYWFSVKLIFEFIFMLDLFLSYPCVLSLYIAYGVIHVCRVMCTPPSYYAQLPPSTYWTLELARTSH